MAPIFEAAEFNGGSGTSRIVNVPAGTSDGDQLLLIASCDLSASQNVTYGVDSSWDELLPLTRSSVSAAGTNLQVWQKTAASEPSSYTVTLSTSRGAIAAIVRVSGQDASDAFDTISILPFDDGTETKIQSITTTVDDCLVLGISSWDQSKTWDGVAPAGWTVGYDANHTVVGVSHDQGGIHKTQATAGATGVAQYTMSSAAPYVSAAIAIQPPQGGDPEPIEIDLGLVTETSTVNALVDLSPEVGTLGLVTESGTVNALVDLSPELITLGTVTETSTLNPLSDSAPLEITLGLIAESGTVTALVDDSPDPPPLLLVGSGSPATAGTTSVTPPAVADSRVGDVAYIYLASKRSGTGTQPSTPSGWTQVLNSVVGSGTADEGSGPIRLQIFRRAAEADDEFDSMPTITRGSDTGSVLAAATQVWRADTGTIEEAASAGSDSGTDDTFIFTTSGAPGFEAEDIALAFWALTNSTGTFPNPGGSVTASGATFGSVTASASGPATGNGDNLRTGVHQATCTAGSSSSAATYSTSMFALGSATTGGGAILRIRAGAPSAEEIDLGLVTETGTVNALSGQMSGSLGSTVTESGTVNELTGELSGTLGVVFETAVVNALISIPPAEEHVLGLVSEAGTLAALTGRLEGDLGAVTEVGTPNALSGQASGTLGSVSETAVVNALSWKLDGTLGLITETGTLNVLGRAFTLGSVIETGTPNALSGRLSGDLGQVAENGSVNGLSGQASGTLGSVDETAVVNALSWKMSGALGLVLETGSVNALSGQATTTLGVITEAGTLGALTYQVGRTLGVVTEDGTLNALSGRAAGSLGLVTETGEVLAVTGQVADSIGLIIETDTVNALTGQLAGTLVLITETGRLRPLVRKFPYTLPQKLIKVTVNPRALKLVIP